MSATLIIMVVTGVVSALAFQRPDLQERLMFNPRAILEEKQYDRLFTTALVHANGTHLFFNGFSFYSFAQGIENNYGARVLLFIYLSAVLGGSLLSLIIHWRQDYRALGASGGVCGIIFASIFLLPGGSIMIFPLPVGIPPLLFAVIFLVGSFLAQRRQLGNIGHDAHLGGAIIGLLTATALFPGLVLSAPGTFALVMVLSLAILVLLIWKPPFMR